MEWPKADGQQIKSKVYGYYFELDWGIQHGRVPSLMYIQMYDPYNVVDLAEKGHVRIMADGSYHACAFTYDFSKSNPTQLTTNENRKLLKKYVRERKLYKNTRRIEAQNIPFTNWWKIVLKNQNDDLQVRRLTCTTLGAKGCDVVMVKHKHLIE